MRLRLIRFYNYNNKILSIANEKFDDKILIFFKEFWKSKR